jgi:tRNA1(Val) A37 N6-methylase TrmN6
VAASEKSYKSATLSGLGRAFRRWAAAEPDLPSIEVAGATADEKRRLGALGGIAASVAGKAVSRWDERVRAWATAAPAPPDEILESVRLALGRYDDPLAELYNASISAENRRRLGTVFTPTALVEHMLSLTERELGGAPDVVLDPGAGVGAFTIAAAQTWPNARIVAVDVNPVTLGLLGARLAFEADADPELADSYNRVELVLADFLDQLVLLTGRHPRGRILVLGNPPYTRVQELPPVDREKAASLAGAYLDSGHANLAMLFQAATLRHLGPRDVSCMVLPGSFSYTRASRALRRALWESRRAVTIHRTPAATKAFVGRSVQAAVLLVGTERQRKTPLRLARVELYEKQVSVLEAWTLKRTEQEPDNWFWSGDREDPGDPSLRSLADIATVRRGTATGANDVFFLTDAEADTIPTDVTVTAIPTLRRFDVDDLTPEMHASLGDESTRRWLLAIPPSYELRGPLAEYVERHADEVSERHLASQRKPWYAITELPRPQILISPLTKTTFKIVVNTAAAVPSNNLFGISLKNGGNPRRLATWLRSDAGQMELRRLSRRYPGGSHKLEPGDLRRVRLPADVAAELVG